MSEGPSEFILTVGVDGSVTVQGENGDGGYGWGPGTTVAQEIVEALEDEGML